MKPDPEHVNRRFRHRQTGIVVAFAGRDIGADNVVLGMAGGAYRLVSLETFDRDFDLLPGMPELTSTPEPTPAAPPIPAIPALLSRLLAAGFDDVEIALRATAAEPHPSYRIIGYWENETISCTQIAGEDEDILRLEAAVMEKLEALKAERAAARPPGQRRHDDGDEPRFMGVPIRLPPWMPPKDGKP